MNNAKTERNEKVFDALLKIAAEELMREKMDALPSLEELNQMYPRSASLDKKIYAIINKEKRRVWRNKALRGFAKAAAVFSIVFVATTAILMSVGASRHFILNMLVDIRNDYVFFDFSQGHAPDGGSDMDIIGAVPDGFRMTSSQTLDSMSLYVFEDERVIR